LGEMPQAAVTAIEQVIYVTAQDHSQRAAYGGRSRGGREIVEGKGS
jgi:hypothetical protein